MPFVLVHGGGFAGSCWDLLSPMLTGPVVAVDLPGRGTRPADLTRVTLADFADAVVKEIVTADLRDVVLVGHSLAGVTLPPVMDRIPERLRHAVFVSCVVPPDGSTVLDVMGTLSPAVSEVASRLGSGTVDGEGRLAREFATAMFCNDMDDAQIEFTLERMVAEALGVLSEPVDLGGLKQALPRTYVRLGQDHSLVPATQNDMAARVGGGVVDVDAAHMAMISAPDALAAVLNPI